MKLKSITVQGFKSFADRTVIHYHSGITGVIGPNGSGKSNVIDAVRWVMGEQTAKSLRADDPTDIIFAGSQSRKHMGTAMVKLTFLNVGSGCPPEFLHLEEISIERRINRSAEREYFMNGEVCRLKDIVDFLLAIGLGSKSYSIIAQERRDRIIQANPEEMREILEEAAGISAFKARRKDAEKRLESTAEKLANLQNLEFELIKQVESLQEQVKKATLKMSLLQDLKHKEVAVLKDRVGFLRLKLDVILADLSAKQLESQNKLVLSAELEARANELTSEQIEITALIERERSLWDDKRIQLTKIKERFLNLENIKKDRQSSLNALRSALDEDLKFFGIEEQNLTASSDELSRTEKLISITEEKFATIESELEETEEHFLVEKSKIEELKYLINATQTGLVTLMTQNESLLQNIEKSNNQTQKLEILKTEQHIQRTRALADHGALVSQSSGTISDMESVLSKRNLLEDQLAESVAKIATLQNQRDHFKTRLVETNTTIQGHTKFLDGVGHLSDGAKALKNQFKGNLLGFVYEMVEVDKEDEHILEKSLPDFLESALVHHFDDLLAILDHAEEKNFSRIDLICPDLICDLTLEEKQLSQEIQTMVGIRNVGNRLKNCKSSELKYFFDRIFIVKDEWIARKVIKQTINKGGISPFLFLTERGAVIQQNLTVSYGKHSETGSEGVLHFKRELESLKLEQAKLQSDLAKIEGEYFGLNAKKEELVGEIASLETLISSEKIENIKLSNAIESSQTNLKNLDHLAQKNEIELEQLIAESLEMRQKFDANHHQIRKLELEKSKYQLDIAELEDSLADYKEKKDEQTRMLSSLRSDRNVAQERLSNFRTQYEQLNMNVSRVQTRIDKARAQISAQEGALEKTGDEGQNFSREIDQLELEVSKYKEKLEVLMDQEAQVDENIRVVTNRLKGFRDLESTLQKFVAEKSAEKAQIQTLLDLAVKDAWDKFQISARDLPTSGAEDNSVLVQLEKDIRDITEKLAAVGPVNERAFEEFKEVEERLTFLQAQKGDIIQSTEELRKGIADIEELSKTKFMETYTQVNTHFQGIFPILFPGGKANLHLLQPDQILTTGVEIMVQLPGKKQQNMALFSGGEKALTAISLIFSLLKTTPAPFCFLDEVDAPLDEANVGRFNDILEALASEFQFVVITHNRRTMEVLDTIYGISMAEPGVSKIVSVDLTEVPEHLQKKKALAAKQMLPENRLGASSVS